MVFEHVGPDGEVKMTTTDPSCVQFERIESSASFGYRFKVDGKFVAKSNVLAAIKASLSKGSESNPTPKSAPGTLSSTTTSKPVVAPSSTKSATVVSANKESVPAKTTTPQSPTKRVSFKDLIDSVI